MVWKIVFSLCLIGAAYIVNKTARWDEPKFKLMLNIFLGIVALMWILQLFGVGVGGGFPIPK